MSRPKLPGEGELFEYGLDLGYGVIVAKIDIDNLWEQKLNARIQSREAFNQLTLNIKNRKGGAGLEALPYCALVMDNDKPRIEIISGHHRIRSVRAAALEKPELKQVWVLLDVTALTRDEILSKQLSHNSIQGFDDPQVLTRIYMEIQSAEMKVQSFIDEKDLKLDGFSSVKITSLNLGVDFKNISLVFLPYQFDDWNNLIARLQTESQVTELLQIAPMEQWEKFRSMVKNIMGLENIKSIGSAMAKITEIVEEYVDAQNESGRNTP